MDESWHTHECVMAHLRISLLTCILLTSVCVWYEWVLSHIRMSHVKDILLLLTSTSGMSESWYTRQGVTTVTSLLPWNNGSSRLNLRENLPKAGDSTTLKLDSDDEWKNIMIIIIVTYLSPSGNACSGVQTKMFLPGGIMVTLRETRDIQASFSLVLNILSSATRERPALPFEMNIHK